MATDIKLQRTRIDNIARMIRFGEQLDTNSGGGMVLDRDTLFITENITRFRGGSQRTFITPDKVSTTKVTSKEAFTEQLECRRDLRIGMLASVTEAVDNEPGSLKVITPKDSPDIHIDGRTSTVKARHFSRTSDERLKQDIKPIVSAQQLLNQIEGVTYRWKDTHQATEEFGLIAQQVETVIPSLVDEDEDGLKSVDYEGLIPLLLESVKQLHAQVHQLETRIIELESASSQP
ncbi:tail fiber domain-containing protein [Grimontia kaedaensis]|uniref:Tail fiber domain-containing protein n=1 Tax=Grimontia kaedaensis TaxID=2872157 RepID=A0ABY4X105_9GAMM|nr:tail fiber domain-containing protein [Grimontia kaedaensis]USH04926.1 tail fiber domain-containing protein [Grimontia kaedaensis]